MKKTMNKPAANGRFRKIAALPSFDNICYFCTLVARRETCWKPQLREAAGTLYAIWEKKVILKSENG